MAYFDLAWRDFPLKPSPVLLSARALRETREERSGRRRSDKHSAHPELSERRDVYHEAIKRKRGINPSAGIYFFHYWFVFFLCVSFLFSSNLYFWCRGLESVPNKHTFTSLYLSSTFRSLPLYIKRTPRKGLMDMWWKVGLVLVLCSGLTSSEAREEHRDSSPRSMMLRMPVETLDFASYRLWCTKRTHITNRVPSAFFPHGPRVSVRGSTQPFPKVRCTLALRTRKSFPHSCACICGSVSHGKRPHILTEVCCRL